MPEAFPRDAADLAERLEQSLDAIARLTRYPHPGRHAAWVERLRVNLPELRAFEASNPRADLGYLAPPPAAVRTADRAGEAVTQGAAGGAARAAAQGLAQAARAAVAQARRRDDL
ncbi:MAG: amidase, partial [Burkholderiales bacterium]